MSFRFLSSLFHRSTFNHTIPLPSSILPTLKRSYSTMNPTLGQDASSKRPESPKTYGTAKNGTVMKIVLTENEARICELLKKVSDYIATKRPDLPLIESRIAGGWVRDKLLGKECNDLDIALNSIMGFEFANYCNDYLKQHGLATRTISKIDSNPAKSKHLETATTKLFDQEIDFCNLRTEVYTEDSRIPAEITFGTPTEDAYRRDTTINSLFYNINTETVEDFTNQGLSDLSLGFIRTPLAPFETFRDDPLRVLRCIRFAGRFGFDMVPELSEAAKDVTIKDALVNKISRERIGTEIDKMISGPSPLLSLQLIHQYGLYSTVFTCPENISQPPEDPYQAVSAVGAVQWLLQDHNNHKSPTLRSITDKDEQRTLYFAASLLPFLSVMSEIKKRPVHAVQLVLRDSLKAPNHDVSTVSTLFRGVPLFQQAVNQLDQKSSISRSDLGMLIRDIGALWQTSLKLALVHDLLLSSQVAWSQPETLDSHLESVNAIVLRYERLLDQAYQYEIQDAHIWKPMIDGKKTTQLLGLKPGPVVQQLLKVMMVWQLEHPDGTVDDCATMMKQYWAENSGKHL